MNPPGVPALADTSIVWDDVSAATADSPGISDDVSTPQWGIFDQDGNPVIVGDSTLSFEYTRDANVSKYPVEDGGFASYNKVQNPFAVKFTFTQGGSVSERSDFLNALDDAQNSLAMFVGMTPEVTYPNITIDHYDTRRSSRNGATLLSVDVWCEQVRVAPPLQFSNSSSTPAVPVTAAANPEANDPVNGGTVQAVTQPQTSTPSILSHGTDSALTVPPIIAVPGISLTNSVGNVLPETLASPLNSRVTYSNALGIVSGTVSSVVKGTTGLTTGYNLNSSILVPVDDVTNILPSGFTVVQ